MRNARKLIVIPLIFILFFINTFSTYAATTKANKVKAKDKYIWIYVNGERKLIPEGYGYPCFGQGRDNKNVLFIPLKVIADIAGYELSPLMKAKNEKGDYVYYANLKGTKEYKVIIGEYKIGDIKLASAPFILKGTLETDNQAIMVPLGFATDAFGLKVEVRRPIGRGVYDFCSLAINFSGITLPENKEDSGIIDVPNSKGTIEDLEDASLDIYYYVHLEDGHYHKEDCELLTKGNQELKTKLSEYEARFWGYTKCPKCFKE